MPVVLSVTPTEISRAPWGPWGYTEFWRNTTPNKETAELMEVVCGLTYRDYPEEAGTYYYWTRFRSWSGKPGDWSDMITVEDYEP